LKGRYAGQVEFGWKIALMPPEAYPVSKSQCEWFYRRSGSIVRSPFMLNSGWFENEFSPCMAPNYVAEAARDFGVNDDRVRLAIAHAALREGRKLGRWDEAVSVGAKAAGVDPGQLQKRAQSPEVAARAGDTTAEFHALQINQRPAFLLENAIGDRVVFSGLVKAAPLAAALDAMLADEAAYASWKAHFGDVPAS
jgi:hypothetical protein